MSWVYLNLSIQNRLESAQQPITRGGGGGRGWGMPQSEGLETRVVWRFLEPDQATQESTTISVIFSLKIHFSIFNIIIWFPYDFTRCRVNISTKSSFAKIHLIQWNMAHSDGWCLDKPTLYKVNIYGTLRAASFAWVKPSHPCSAWSSIKRKSEQKGETEKRAIFMKLGDWKTKAESRAPGWVTWGLSHCPSDSPRWSLAFISIATNHSFKALFLI